MVPFMNTYYVAGPAARAMDGADISYIVGIVVAGGLYLWLRRYAMAPAAAPSGDGSCPWRPGNRTPGPRNPLQHRRPQQAGNLASRTCPAY